MRQHEQQRGDADLAVELQQRVLAEGARGAVGARDQRQLERHQREPQVAEGVGERDAEVGGVGRS